MDGTIPPDDEPVTLTEAEGATVDLPEGPGIIATGQVEGDRYEIMEMLGRGGMGEVWHAFDLKLRVEVALKALREDLFQSERRLELLRQEVRAAREVVSPNVCRIFDLIEIDGRELVSMEYVDGATLLGVLQERGPLDLKEAQDIASQFLAGLEAIHKAGLIHRDVKPENIMLTRAGRVVVMDFGLARQEAEGGGSASGTPAYMAPEHSAGDQVDARADVYSAGVVLAEMVSPDGIKSMESRSSVWKGVRSEPAQIPDSPWAPVIERAVARDRDRRPNSAHTLIRELENVTMRVESAEGLHPYPGLASFGEEDAEYFFGREAEIEQMWRRLEGPTRMLALVGPSGAGKTSFVHAGLLPTRRPGWSHIVCTPGSDPRASLRRAVISELEDDAEAIRELAVGDDDSSVAAVERWARRSDHALVVVDQFEELFTQNTADEQHRFTTLLGRLALDADVFVLVSIRDDFLFHCHRYEALRPVLSDLTMLGPPEGAALRRALVQPATKCGYRFEDDELVDEMLAEVEGERGALPMLAFAASRLWERRDSQSGLLTRQATIDIGGVSGALARHAEATIDLIGVERIPIVRELFRNLVTAEGTRAVREWDDLLSIFSDSRSESQEVLRALVDARLLTSYEIRDGDQEPTRMVEIIHESLLANWPRLVRWQTQDQEGAQLRDELRQSARAWDEHGRHDDRLWTGTAYREFRLWRERYPGGLTEVEEAFGEAMISFANRRRRRRQIAVTTSFIVLALVLAVVGTLWRRSVVETRRAEAAGLLSQAQAELEGYPTVALAHATKSLEIADSVEARKTAVAALWQGPTSFVVNEIPSYFIGFGPNGRFLVQTTDTAPHSPIHVIDDSGGDEILAEYIPPNASGLVFGAEEEFASFRFRYDQPVVFWSATEKRMKARFEIDNAPWSRDPVWLRMDDDNRLVLISGADRRITAHVLTGDGRHHELGNIDLQPVTDEGRWLLSFPPGGRLITASTGHDLFVIEIGSGGLSQPRLVGRQDTEIVLISSDATNHVIATLDTEGRVRLWDMTGTKEPILLSESVPPDSDLRFTRDGSLLEVRTWIDRFAETRIWALEGDTVKFLRHIDLGKDAFGGWSLNPARLQVASVTNPDNKIRLWSIRAPADAAPIIVRQGAAGAARGADFHPGGYWMATSYSNGLKLWPVVRDYAIVIDEYEERPISVVFGPEGDWMAACTLDGPGLVRVWSLGGETAPSARVLFEAGTYTYDLAASPDGNHLLLGTHSGGARYLSLEGESPEAPTLDTSGFAAGSLAFDADGRVAAGTFRSWETKKSAIKAWDLESKHVIGEWREGDDDDLTFATVRFLNSDALLVGVPTGGLVEWNPETDSKNRLLEASVDDLAVDAAGTLVLSKTVGRRGPLRGPGQVMVTVLASGETKTLVSHGQKVMSIAMDRAGTIVATGDSDGVIRVGPITGEEPHLLLGSTDEIRDLAIDPKGRWIASVSGTTLRLWPMPDLSKPPLHTLPREELIAKLKTLTNLRVVRDPESATGWTLTHDPFPGWETVPSW